MSLLTLDKRDGERAFRLFPKMPPKNYFFKVATPSAMRLQPSTTYERGQARFMRRKPLPSLPKDSPGLRPTLQTSTANLSSSSCVSKPRPLQSIQSRYVASGV